MAVDVIEAPLIMVTGATGFLGTHVVHRLTEAGERSRVLAASRAAPEALTLDTVRWCALDLADPGLSVPAGIDTVIHVAGEKSNVTKMHEVNHHGTRRLIEACSRVGVRRFVFVSSVGVYGAVHDAGLVDESWAHHPRNTYELSKDAGEAEVRSLCPRLGMEFVILQPSNVIGRPSNGAYPLLGFMSSIKSGRFLYFGAQETRLNYVCVQDVAAAVVAASRHAHDKFTYIVNTSARLTALVGWIADELRVDAPSRHYPRWVGACAARSAGVLASIVGRSLPLDRDRYLELTNTTEYDGRAIERDLGLRYPSGIESAVRTLARGYRAEGRL